MVFSRRNARFLIYILSFVLLNSGFLVADGAEGEMPEPIAVGNVGQGFENELEVSGCHYPPGQFGWNAIWAQGRMSANDASTLRDVFEDARGAFELQYPEQTHLNWALVFVYSNLGQPFDPVVVLHQDIGYYHFKMHVGGIFLGGKAREMWICPSPTDGDFGQCAHFEISDLREALTTLCGPLPRKMESDWEQGP